MANNNEMEQNEKITELECMSTDGYNSNSYEPKRMNQAQAKS